MCDVWQASNTDTYFAVTGHWIEEHLPRVWSIEQALLGFVQMNTAHNGVCLGQVLYKVCNHLQIVPKVGVNTFQLTLLNMLFIRLATSLVTMPRTTTQCFKSLHTAISSRQVPLSM
jgi:hypothetical protein